VGAANSNNSLTGLTTIASNGELDLDAGVSVTTSGALTINSGGVLRIDNFSAGGSSLKSGGSLTNAGYLQIGNSGMTTAPTVNVTGTFTNTGGRLVVDGGSVTGANGLLNVNGAAPGTLTGSYMMNPNVGSAAVEWSSGGVTSIGDGSSHSGSVVLSGNAFLKIGAANSNSALTGLTTIASNGELDLDAGVSVTTSGALTINSGGVLRIDNFTAGGSSLTSKGSLTNNGYLQVGNTGLSSPATLNAAAALTNGGNGSVVVDGGNTGGNAVIDMTGPTIANAGNINLNGNVGNATLEIGANVTASGTGAIKLSNIATNLITGTSPTFTLTNGSTIEGSGTMTNMGIVNTGTIAANQSTPLLILPSSLGLNNKGTLSISPGDTMRIGTSSGGALTNFSGTTLTGGTYSVGGTLQFGASGTSIVTDAAKISLTGPGAQIIDFGGSNVLKNLATIASGGSFSLGANWGTFTTTGNFTNNGTLSVGSGDQFIVNLAHSLTNFSGTTLTGGTYSIGGTFQFNGANIVTNAANITLIGGGKIVNQTSANGLANFATNASGASFGLVSANFTTAGNFTNNGTLTLGSGTTFKVNGNLTNFSGTTLTGGIYNVTGTLQFNGANIVTNAANITLTGTGSKIVNQTAGNALANFKTNAGAGKFTLSGNQSLTTSGGNFSNAGTFTINTGSTFTVGGSTVNFTQTAGKSTIDGTLQGGGPGSLSLNGGSLFGGGTLGYSVTDSGTITPGDSSTKTGILTVTNNYGQNSGGALDISIGGATVGTKYDQLKVNSSASLSGTLNVSLVNGFTPAVGQTFDILNANSLSGVFGTVNGLSINSSEHFSISYTGTEAILTVVSGPSVIKGSSAHQARQNVHGIHMMSSPALRRFRPADLQPVVAVAAAMQVGPPHAMSPMSLASSGSLPAPNTKRFECGVDVKALLKTSPKRLLKDWLDDPSDPSPVGWVTMSH
jgi:hypothetical protein